jgi:hypothetical protein
MHRPALGAAALAAALLAPLPASAWSVPEFDDFAVAVASLVESPTAPQEKVIARVEAAAAATYASGSLELKALARSAQQALKAFKSDGGAVAAVDAISGPGGPAFTLATAGEGGTVQAGAALRQEFGIEKGDAKAQATMGKHLDKVELEPSGVKRLKLMAKARKVAEKTLAKYGTPGGG